MACRSRAVRSTPRWRTTSSLSWTAPRCYRRRWTAASKRWAYSRTTARICSRCERRCACLRRQRLDSRWSTSGRDAMPGRSGCDRSVGGMSTSVPSHCCRPPTAPRPRAGGTVRFAVAGRVLRPRRARSGQAAVRLGAGRRCARALQHPAGAQRVRAAEQAGSRQARTRARMLLSGSGRPSRPAGVRGATPVCVAERRHRCAARAA